MKVLFAGPSLYPPLPDLPAIDLQGPARQGDIARAVRRGATSIGLVDGLFETVASVWHKEILFALSEGVTVLGGASMGALRAAECAPFGMIGIGTIYRRYASGELDDDAAVALLHAPAEFGFRPLTEALVNVEATLAALVKAGALHPVDAQALSAAARSLHFTERTYRNLLEEVRTVNPQGLLAILLSERVDLKREDAGRVVEALHTSASHRGPAPAWKLSRTRLFDRLLQAEETPEHVPVTQGSRLIR